jgi:hypothetical protein
MDTWNRPEHYSEFTEERDRLAATTLSSQIKTRYLLMAKDYTLLADLEEQARTCYKTATPEPVP